MILIIFCINNLKCFYTLKTILEIEEQDNCKSSYATYTIRVVGGRVLRFTRPQVAQRRRRARACSSQLNLMASN
jgi:hypothetical protein